MSVCAQAPGNEPSNIKASQQEDKYLIQLSEQKHGQTIHKNT